MTLGPVMLDLVGTELDAEERELLQHPLVGGVILFSRNYAEPEQLKALVDAIHTLHDPGLLVAVDHEGGRVQRFRDGFTELPPARRFGQVFDTDRKRARNLARQAGWVMASELRAVGVDFSFAPVLDIDREISRVIGDRAFHSDPQIAADLAGAYMLGMREAGMSAVGKHFPGHGGVAADSHTAIPIDKRPLADIWAEDIIPFERMIANGLAGVMPAHVIYESVDLNPAGFSYYWLHEVLRKRLNFQGVIFSDDLSMAGAGVAGDHVARAEMALYAGVDMVLVCNDRKGAVSVLDSLKVQENPVVHSRLARMHGRHPVTREHLAANQQWQQARAALTALNRSESDDLFA